MVFYSVILLNRKYYLPIVLAATYLSPLHLIPFQVLPPAFFLSSTCYLVEQLHSQSLPPVVAVKWKSPVASLSINSPLCYTMTAPTEGKLTCQHLSTDALRRTSCSLRRCLPGTAALFVCLTLGFVCLSVSLLTDCHWSKKKQRQTWQHVN